METAAGPGEVSTGVRGVLWRHRFTVAALLLNVVLAAALVQALVERHEARLAQQRAERQFAAVRALAEVFVVDVHRALERVPGSAAVRQTIVDTAVTYLHRLGGDALDPPLRIDLAGLYRRVGDIQAAGMAAAAVDGGAAMMSYDRGLALVEPLVAQAQAARAAHTEFAMLAERKGALLMALGRWSDAEALGLRGLGTARRLVAADPANPADRRLLGTQYRFLTSLYQRAGKPKEFAAVSAQAVEQLEQVVAMRAAEDVDSVADLAAIHTIRAVQLEQDLGTPEARQSALGEYYQSLAVMKAVVERQPTQPALAADYGRVNRFTGQLLAQLGRPPESLEYHRRAVEIVTTLAGQDPSDVRMRVERAEAHAQLGAALRATGDNAGAAAASQQALAIFDALPDTWRDAVAIQYERAGAHLELGRALEAQAATRRTPPERHAELIAACVHHARAQRLLEENLKRRPGTAALADKLSEVEAALARCGQA